MNNNYQREYDIAVAIHDTLNRDRLISDHDTEILIECSQCDDMKPIYQFWKEPTTKSGLRRKCICCSKENYAKKKHIIKALYYNYQTKIQLQIKATDARMIKLQKRQIQIIKKV